MAKYIVGFLLVIFLFTPDSFGQTNYPATLTVAQDGTGNYKTIQEAVNSVRDLGEQRVQIYIKKGKYHEKVIIPSWKTKISLIGESPEATIITGNDYSGKLIPGGKDGYTLEKYSTYTSFTVLVQGNDAILENLTIENTAGRVGQAVALHVEGDRIVVRNCHILGNQDTLYTAKEESRQYYENCIIEGTTDFIFGEATCVFQSCTIRSLSESYITASAQRKSQKFGYVFFDCKLIAAPEAKKVYLGRPWRPYAKTVFIRTQMGAHIIPEGWHAWPGDKMFPDKEKTAFYAEYQSAGAGTAQRVPWSKQLSKKEAEKYTLENIFKGEKDWIINQAN
ncbi:pectinesterase family protein [Adhaeribacter radiodurans]|uniref:Pectinesterase n=1 Tax=Adhaeribacter radiodurans TaxID=2745197 RepID=A0A7L7L2R1_9BACT|nr:pectinesterase family protein [Adhaeribacter radiodurans]QMU27078.1 pectin esterase [Adhaeribacter radiodurans]